MITTNSGPIITRVFDLPCKSVWKAWTDPDYFMRWWGPKDFTSPFCKLDLRADGKYLCCMRSKKGQDFWSTGTYNEIVPLKRIVYTDSFADENEAILGSVAHTSKPKRLNNFMLGSLWAKIYPRIVFTPNFGASATICRTTCLPSPLPLYETSR